MKNDTKKKQMKNIFMVAGYIIGFTLIVVLFQYFFYSPMRVVGDSMKPTFHNNDILLVNRYIYKGSEPKRFDLIVFTYKYDMNTQYIKRVIGLPGETVEIKDNKIYIDSKELKEYYGRYESGEKTFDDYPSYTLDYDEYFVLGDNRDVSVDSRSGDVGPVEKDMIIGKAAFRLWPFSSVGSLKYQ